MEPEGKPSQARSPESGWVVLSLTTIVHANFALSSAALPTLAPKVADDLGVSASLVGIQVSLVFAAGMFSSLVAGVAVRRNGACRTIQAAQLFIAAAMALTMVPSLAAMAVGALLLGVSCGLTNPATGHLLFRFTDSRRRNVMFSVKQSGVPIGGMLAGLTMPPLATAFGWQVAFACIGSLSLALFVLLRFRRSRWDDDRDAKAPLRHNPLNGLKVVWNAPVLRWLSLTAACFAAIQLCLTTFMVTMLVEELGFSIVTAGLTFALCQGAGMLGRVVLGWTSDRLGAARVLIALGIAVTAASFITSMLSRAWETQLVSAFLTCYGFASLSWTGIYLAQVARHSSAGQVGVTTGASMFFNFVGIAIGPALVAGSYAVFHDYRTSFAALALVGIAGTTAAYLAAMRERAT